MSIEEDISYEPKTIGTSPCYFDTSVEIKHVGLTCYDDLMLVLTCMIACNTHLATQLASLESFECTHKEIFFLRDH